MTIAQAEVQSSPAKPKRKQSLIKRALVGGHLSDLGRLPRYIAFFALGATMIWAPITGYLKTAPLSFKSHASLILPGSGASASMNLNGIGQASSFANSAFASNSVSPTETYKRLLSADRILTAAAMSLDIPRSAFGGPRIDLVDQTSLIHVEMTGGTPEEAQRRSEALLAAFFVELDALRSDEVQTREDSGLIAIETYRQSVSQTRADIETLQAESGLLSVEHYDVLLDRHLALDVVIREKSAQVDELSSAVAALELQLGVNPSAAAATLKLFADGTYMSMLAEVGRFVAEATEANAKYGAQHPKVEEAIAARNAAQKAALDLAQTITGLSGTALNDLDLAPNGARAELLAQLVRMDSDRVGASTELATLQAQYASGQVELESLSFAAAKLQDLQRDFSVAEAVFASAIARAQTSKSDVYASYPLVQVLENPSLAENPSSPNRKLALAAGVAATMMLLFSLIMGWVRLAVISRLLAKPEGEK